MYFVAITPAQAVDLPIPAPKFRDIPSLRNRCYERRIWQIRKSRLCLRATALHPEQIIARVKLWLRVTNRLIQPVAIGSRRAQPFKINAELERAADLAHHTLQKKYDGLDERNRRLIAEFSAKIERR